MGAVFRKLKYYGLVIISLFCILYFMFYMQIQNTKVKSESSDPKRMDKDYNQDKRRSAKPTVVPKQVTKRNSGDRNKKTSTYSAKKTGLRVTPRTIITTKSSIVGKEVSKRPMQENSPILHSDHNRLIMETNQPVGGPPARRSNLLATITDPGLDALPRDHPLTKWVLGIRDLLTCRIHAMQVETIGGYEHGLVGHYDTVLAMRERVKLMRERCKPANLHLPNLTRPLQQGGTALKLYNKFFFCSIPKTGTQLFHQLLHKTDNIQVASFLNSTERRKVARMIFVREPFSRFVSGYISKIFTVFQSWFELQRKASVTDRVKPSCGHDLTFREFIKFVLHELETHGHTNVHWAPHSARCLPCRVQYNFIGKLETANDDVQMFISQTKLPQIQTAKQYLRQYQRTNIISSLNRGFRGNNCTSLPQALERVWVAYQMRGIISHKLHFPYRAIKRYKYLSVHSFLDLMTRLSARYPVTLKTKKLIKKVVLRNAFSRIEASDIEKIRKLYYKDFYLYGYNMYPDFLTDKIPMSVDGWQPFKLKLR